MSKYKQARSACEIVSREYYKIVMKIIASLLRNARESGTATPLHDISIGVLKSLQIHDFLEAYKNRQPLVEREKP